MPPPTTLEKESIIINALSRGMSRSNISEVCGISKRAITRINTNLKKHGSAKAPPSGVKLGRPVKLTSVQADAMVLWMAKEEHTFYVKDLVAFLREQYRFEGCDGTVRRCLMRAGYRRKLPWHKSEKTVWIPPEYKPVFIVSGGRRRKIANQTGGSTPMFVDAVSDGEDDQNDAEVSARIRRRCLAPDAFPQPVPLSLEGHASPHRRDEPHPIPQPLDQPPAVQATPPHTTQTQGRRDSQFQHRLQINELQRQLQRSDLSHEHPVPPGPPHSLQCALPAPIAGQSAEVDHWAEVRRQLAEKDAMIAHLQRQLATQQQDPPQQPQPTPPPYAQQDPPPLGSDQYRRPPILHDAHEHVSPAPQMHGYPQYSPHYQ